MSFRFTVIKKNQILACAVTMMFVTAGYLNYKYDPNRPYDIEVTGIIEENLGDAVLVDANGVIEDTTPVFYNSTDLVRNDKNDLHNSEKINQETNKKISGDLNNQSILMAEKVFKEIEDYFISTRIDRTNNYAQQIESYENILENESVSNEQKNKAQEQIEEINRIRNSIMIAENLIKLKGFEETVILVNEDSINVIVASENLTSAEVAKIQSIIVNEFSVDISKVHIINYD